MFYYYLHQPQTWLFVLAAIILMAVRRRLLFIPGHLLDKIIAEQEKSQEISLLRKAAKKGDVEAQVKLGDAYFNGTLFAEDHKKAIEEYIKAADMGSAEACLKLGDIFYEGPPPKEIVFADPEGTSTGWEQRDAAAKRSARMKANKTNILKNDDEATLWYIKAFHGGLLRAQKRLQEVETRFLQTMLLCYKGGDMKECEITYGYAPNDYKVFLTAKNLDVFQQASENTEVRNKKGEDFVSALVKMGGILRIDRFRDNRPNDGLRGEPAVQIFNESGTQICVMRYRDDRLQDGANSAPAFQAFSDKGTILRTSHYKHGVRNDADNGEAGLLRFNENGKLIWAAHYKDEDILRALSEQEIATYFETAKIASSIEKAIPGIKIH